MNRNIGSGASQANQIMNESMFRRARVQSDVRDIKCSEAEEMLVTNGSENNTFNIRERESSLSHSI